ncbi:MAG: hypothetical protein ACR2FM_03210 [Candidatus Saccharimonadales bacterium]
MNDASLPVAVTITSKDAPCTINKVSVEVIRESRNRSFGETESSSNLSESMAQAENTEVFTLAAGETKTVQIAIVMNAGKFAAESLPANSGLAQVAGALEKLQSISQAMNQNSYEYYLSGYADVEGITFDPSGRQPIQILKPGQVGGAINFGS